MSPAQRIRKAREVAIQTAQILEEQAAQRHRLAENAIERARRADTLAEQAQDTVRYLTSALYVLES